MDISNIKQVKSYARSSRYGYKGDILREKLNLFSAAQNNIKRIIYSEAKIDKTQQNTQCMLCREREREREREVND